MEPSGPLPEARRVLGLSSLGHFINDGTTFFVPVIAALLGPVRGFSPLDVTILFVVYYVTSAVLGLFVGWWADRHGRPAYLMAVGIGLLGLGLFLFYVVLAGLGGPIGYPVALIAGSVTGFATSFYHPLGASLLQRAFRPERRGVAMGINGAAGSIGRASYPVLFFLVTLAVVTSDAILLFAAFGVLAAFAIASGLRSVVAAERKAVPSTGSNARESVTGGIIRLTGVSFVRSVASQGVAVWIPTYLTAVRGVPASGALGLAVAVMYVGGILGQPVFGLLVSVVDRRLLIGLASAGSALTTLGYLFTGGVTAGVLLFLIGFFTFSAFPLLMTLSAEYVPSGPSSLANALVFGLGSGGGSTVGPLIVGAIAAGGYALLTTGLEAMVALGIVSAFLVLLLPPVGRAARVSLFG